MKYSPDAADRDCPFASTERVPRGRPAMEPNLTAGELTEIERAVPPGAARGDRCPSAFMSGLGMGN